MTEADTAKTTSDVRSKLSEEDQNDFDAVNAAIDRMRTLTAPNPYILTIPQDVEPRYHHAYRYQLEQWWQQGPFAREEGEEVQYQTFVYHEHGKDMYVLHNSLPKEEREKPNLKAGGESRPGTGANTPTASLGPKKKISLDAYKKLKSGSGGGAAGAAQGNAGREEEGKLPAVKGPAERVKAETEEVLAAVAEEDKEPEVKMEQDRKRSAKDLEPAAKKAVMKAVGPALKQAVGAEKKDIKRKREDGEDEPRNADAPKEAVASQEPATKKLRRELPPTKASKSATPPALASPVKKAAKPTSPPAQSPEQYSLPPKLSPLWSLPARLSPTLPANIEASLKAKKAASIESLTPPVSKSDTLTPKLGAELAGKKKAPVNVHRATSSSPAVRSDAEEKRTPWTTSVPRRERSPERSPAAEAAGRRAANSEETEKLSLIVKLNYKKHRREDVRRILKIRPNPVKPPPTVSPPGKEEEPRTERSIVRRRDPTAKGVAQKVGPVAKKTVEEKRLNVKKEESPRNPPNDGIRPTNLALKRSEAGTKAPDKSAAPVERPAKPDIQRYEPPGRRNSSGTLPNVVQERATKASESALKRKASDEGKAKGAPVAKAKPEPAPRKTKEAAHITAEEPAAKRKRPAEDDAEEPALKRKKIPDKIEIVKPPSTSLQSEQSPTLQRSQQVTPSIKRDHLSAIQQVKDQSFATAEASTPSPDKSSTPTIAGTSSQVFSSQPARSSISFHPKTPAQQAWDIEQRRLEDLGRSLKHAASDHLKQRSHAHSASKTDQHIAAVKSIESLLAFFLAFVSADLAAAAAEPKQPPPNRTWKSLHGFLPFVKRNCEGVPLLQGLVQHLGVVYSAKILEASAHAGGKQGFQENDSVAGLFKSARDAERLLNLDALLEAFPRTWKGRAKGPAAPEDDKVEPGGSFAGQYRLPIGVQTSPLGAARAGYAILREWMQKEGVNYELELKL